MKVKNILVIGLGGQGEKYINYFLKNNYIVFGVCKTNETKQKIEKKYNIGIDLSYKDLDYTFFDIIIIALPPKIQGEVSLFILDTGYRNKMIIEIPITWNNIELEKLKQYKNIVFFLEEYYTLLSRFLRKIDIKKIKGINISILTNQDDYESIEARKVTFIHINNNFLGTNIDFKNINYNFNFHGNENIFYKVTFKYNGTNIEYLFNKEKYLKIGDKKYIDDYNFDNVLNYIINEKNNFNKYYL